MANQPYQYTPHPSDSACSTQAHKNTDLLSRACEKNIPELLGNAHYLDTCVQLVVDVSRESLAPHGAFAALQKAHTALATYPDHQTAIIEAIANINHQVSGRIPEIAAFVEAHAPRAAKAAASGAAPGSRQGR